MDVAEEELQSLYTWVDEIPLSRPKRNIARDFSDGVLLAEVVHHYFPKLVELHNYSSANSLQQKQYNWNTLNTKVFRRLGFTLPKQITSDISNAVPGAVERALKMLKMKIAAFTDSDMAADSPQQSTSHGSDAHQAYQPGQLQASNSTGHGIGSRAAVPAKLHAAALQSNGSVSSAVLVEKEHVIRELQETNEILETKVRKLEQLVKLKDAKIQTLMAKLQAAGLA